MRGSGARDWSSEAINSRAGKIAEALFSHPHKNELKAGKGFPASWLSLVNEMLLLEGDARCHVLSILSYNLVWFHIIDPKWTEANLISRLEKGPTSEREAIWDGFFWGARFPNSKLFERLKPSLLRLARNSEFRGLSKGYENVLCSMLLSGWASKQQSGKRYISNAELYEVILHSSDEFRSQMLWQVEHVSELGAHSVHKTHTDRLIEFLKDVWPRQKSVKTASASVRLCDLAFSDAKNFPIIADIVLPLLTTIDREYLFLPNLRRSKDNLADLYPEKVLAILHAILPDNVAAWPFATEATLRRIRDGNPILRNDERLLELLRRWNSR
ncbi:hypothetical protein ACFOYU_23020 [Microvirga sp. GCM10011540]|uniref:hypothetical protein n=1 Tax=Microvirga sp. GCM10011540 TaxID=3317338 RepID=UPI00361194A9